MSSKANRIGLPTTIDFTGFLLRPTTNIYIKYQIVGPDTPIETDTQLQIHSQIKSNIIIKNTYVQDIASMLCPSFQILTKDSICSIKLRQWIVGSLLDPPLCTDLIDMLIINTMLLYYRFLFYSP